MYNKNRYFHKLIDLICIVYLLCRCFIFFFFLFFAAKTQTVASTQVCCEIYDFLDHRNNVDRLCCLTLWEILSMFSACTGKSTKFWTIFSSWNFKWKEKSSIFGSYFLTPNYILCSCVLHKRNPMNNYVRLFSPSKSLVVYRARFSKDLRINLPLIDINLVQFQMINWATSFHSCIFIVHFMVRPIKLCTIMYCENDWIWLDTAAK